MVLLPFDEKTRLVGRRGRGREHIAGGDRRSTAVGQTQHQRASLVERLETAGEFALSEPYTHAFAHAARAGKPVGADGRKALAGIPLREPPEHLDRERAEQRGGRDRRAGGGEIGGRKIRLCRMRAAIDSDADRNRAYTALRFDQDAAQLRARQQKIVRPLNRQQPLEIGRDFYNSIVGSERSDE